MAIVQQITCDVCGKLKQQVNHWYLLWIEKDSGFHFQPWANTTSATVKHICGQECAVKALSEWMQKAKQ